MSPWTAASAYLSGTSRPLPTVDGEELVRWLAGVECHPREGLVTDHLRKLANTRCVVMLLSAWITSPSPQAALQAAEFIISEQDWLVAGCAATGHWDAVPSTNRAAIAAWLHGDVEFWLCASGLGL